MGNPGSLLPHLQDLAQCVNEVKRDNETLRQITNFQLSIENLVRGWDREGRGVAMWEGCLVFSLVAPCQPRCLLPRTSLWLTTAAPRSMGSSRSPPWSGAPRWTGGWGLGGGRPRFLDKQVGGA